MSDRTILHIDMNNFYASVECMMNPELKAHPIAVCGSQGRPTRNRPCKELQSQGIRCQHRRSYLAGKAEMPGSRDRSSSL